MATAEVRRSLIGLISLLVQDKEKLIGAILRIEAAKRSDMASVVDIDRRVEEAIKIAHEVNVVR